MTREYTIVAPDGQELVIIAPENATPEQLRGAAERAYAIVKTPEKQFPPERTPMNYLRAGLGGLAQQTKDLLGGAVRGAGSIGATILDPQDALNAALFKARGIDVGPNTRRQDMTDATRMLGADPESLTYGASKLGSEIAGTLGVPGAIGGAVAQRLPVLGSAIASSGMKAGGMQGIASMAPRIAGGAVAGGASAGLIEPDAAWTGALLGGALPPVFAGLGKAGSAVGSVLKPAVSNPALAEKAINQYGIPLGASDIAASGMVKGARSALDDSWIVGGIGRKRQELVQEAYNKAVGNTFGAPVPKLTPSIVDSAKKKLGAEFDRIWGGNTLKLDGQYVNDLRKIQDDALSKLNPEQAAQIDRQIQNLLGKAQGAEIPGSFANNWQSELRMVADGEKGLHKKLLSDLRRSTIEAFNRSILPEDAAALSLNLKQYKAFKTVEPLLQKGEAGTAGRAVGDIPAGLLPEAVRQSYKGNIAGSPFADLSQIGSQFIADRVPRTGGSARAAVQNLAIGGGMVANWPIATAGLVGAAGLEGLLSSPMVARGMLPKATPRAGLLEFEKWLSRAAPAIAADQ
jgi:hypothetical protein